MDLAHALEAYHRRLFDGEYMTEEEYDPIETTLIDAIPQNISAEHRDSLKSRIKYGYQYSLRTRLKNLLSEVLAEQSEATKTIVGNQPNFIKRLVETRNYFTHLDGEANSAVLKTDELYEFTLNVRLLLQICFLKEMEFPANEISRILNNNWKYKRLTKTHKSQ